MRRGEIWWGETASSKGRPYLVLTRDAAIGVMTSVVVAPITSTVRAMPSALSLGAAEGLNRECIANFDGTRSIRVSLLTRRLGMLGPERMHEICAAMRAAIDC